MNHLGIGPLSARPTPPSDLMADTMYDRIQAQIESFTEELESGHAILVEVLLPGGERVLAKSFSYHNPRFIMVECVTADGLRSTVVLDFTQFAMRLSAVDTAADTKPAKIGFHGNMESEA